MPPLSALTVLHCSVDAGVAVATAEPDARCVSTGHGSGEATSGSVVHTGRPNLPPPSLNGRDPQLFEDIPPRVNKAWLGAKTLWFFFSLCASRHPLVTCIKPAHAARSEMHLFSRRVVRRRAVLTAQVLRVSEIIPRTVSPPLPPPLAPPSPIQTRSTNTWKPHTARWL